ncbi:MAG: TetR/AcrR family transcriptional regulator [Solirubrobacteraceae bacterium]
MAIVETISTRERILHTSAELFRRQGYAGTGVKQILSEAGVPSGSLYHSFPRGKQQLADEVLRSGGAFFLALYEAIAAEAPDFEHALRDFFAGACETLSTTDFADACPIATIAGEIASTHPNLRRATADVFESWLAAIAADGVAAGLDAARARELAIAILSLLEGAFLLSRSLRSVEPLRTCSAAAADLLAGALASQRKDVA